MIKNIVFDIGNVLLGFGWKKFLVGLYGEDNRQLIDDLTEAIFGDARWDRLDNGDDFDEVINAMIAHNPALSREIHYVFENVGKCVTRWDSSIGWIKSLKERGLNVYYLSNYSQTVMNANPESLDFLPLMDGGIFSCYVHLLKPDHRIYECLLKKYNLIPKECVFIDDLERNVAGAVELGFHGIQCLSVEQTQCELNKLLEEEAQ